MLIKVFGIWINPDLIYTLNTTRHECIASCNVFNKDDRYIRFSGKTADEVAQEINRQIKEGK